MKRLVSLFATIMALMAVACGNDDVDKPTPKPGPEDPSNPVAPFVVDITAVTRGSVTFSVTPADPTIDYLCMVYEKEIVESYRKDEYLVETIISDLESEASKKGKTLAEYMPDVVDSGDIIDDKISGLGLESDYYIVVFGVEESEDGFTNSTELVKVPFTTLSVEMSDCTFDVTTRVLYNNVTFNVYPSDKDMLWYLCTVTKEYYDSQVGDGNKSDGEFYKEYFQQEINTYLQQGYPAEQVVSALIHSGDLSVGAKGLFANTEYYYFIAGMIMDEEGIVITTDITSGTYTTEEAEPSEMYFDIQVYDVQQMSVSFTVTPSNDDDYYVCIVQPYDGVSTADEVMHEMVDQWGPGWMGVMANTKGFVDFASKPKSLPAADMEYCIIAFGYEGGITTEAYMATFKTLPGGSVEDVQFSVNATSITPYGFTLTVTSSDPTIYYVPGACIKEEYNEEACIAAVNEEFDYYLEETLKFDISTIEAEVLDQYYSNGTQTFSLSGLKIDTEYMVYVYALDINTGHVVKTFTFDAVARTGTLGSIHPTVELVGYYSGDDEAGSIWGDKSLTAGRAITVVKYAGFDGASELYTTMLEGDCSDILEYPDAYLWSITNGIWKTCSLSQPYTFYLSDWNFSRTAMVHAEDAEGKAGYIGRLLTMPTAENKSDIEELRALKERLDEESKSTRSVLPASLVVPEKVKVTEL
ncbi:MAG: hypothetical protein J6V55_00675 [Alistipes sp.]|nr:hypothetical protein [Alistipes sp.]